MPNTEVTRFLEPQICGLGILPSLSPTFGLYLNRLGDSGEPQRVFIACGLSGWSVSVLN